MNVSNGMKLGLPLQAQPAPGKSNSSSQPQKSGAASFTEVLGKTQDKPEKKVTQDKPENEKPALNKGIPQKAAPQKAVAKRNFGPKEKLESDESDISNHNSQQDQDGEVQADSADQNGLPTGPTSGFQGLQGPVISERVVTANTEVQALGGANAKTPVAKTEGDEVDSLTRRVVWNDFLRKMKDDLGVSADDVMQAFASLSDEELSQPAQQTLDKVVLALGLTPQEAQIAKTHFQELVQKTKSTSLGSELDASSKQIGLTLMSQRELQRKAMQKSIDNMGQNFFMNSPEQLQAQIQARMLAAQQMAAQDTAQPTKQKETFFAPPPATSSMMASQGMPAMPMPMSTPSAPAAALETLSTETPDAAAAKAAGKEISSDAKLNRLVENMQAQQPQMSPVDQKAMESLAREWNAAKMSEAKGLAPQMKQAEAVVPATGSAASGLAKPGPVTTSAGIAAALGGIFAAAKGEDSSEAGDDESTFDQFASQATAAAGQAKHADGVGGDFKAQMTAAAQGPQAMAIPELIQNAEVMVKDGGGEMKITLKDEGLGEVAMKVNVENGRVSVQMITESDEAKKMIEKEMAGLKVHLSQHNLNVDQIKVDTATNMGNQLDQQYQDNQRQQAQAFMENFRQEQQGWRRNLLDVPGSKLYKGQADAPRDIRAPAKAQAKGSRRLNLVA